MPVVTARAVDATEMVRPLPVPLAVAVMETALAVKSALVVVNPAVQMTVTPRARVVGQLVLVGVRL